MLLNLAKNEIDRGACKNAKLKHDHTFYIINAQL